MSMSMSMTRSAVRALRQVSRPASTSPRAWAVAAPLSSRWAGQATRAFSVSARRLGEGASDISLVQKLSEELKYEKDVTPAGSPEPEFLTTFKGQGVWEIVDQAGNDEVTIQRKFGNETIRLMFSIADIQNEQELENEEGEENEEGNQSYPVRCSFSFTKTGTPGALTIDAMCQDGAFVVDNISFYGDAKIGTDLTAEADWKRRGLYIGPQFDTLDLTVQEEFEKFLQERGINESLALFIPDYAELKEQKEYLTWLGNVKTFIEA